MAVVVCVGPESNGALVDLAARLAAARDGDLHLVWLAAGKASGPIELSEPIDRSTTLPAWLLPTLTPYSGLLTNLHAWRLGSDWTADDLAGMIPERCDLVAVEVHVCNRDRGLQRLDALAAAIPSPLLVLRGDLATAPRKIILALAGGRHGTSAAKLFAPLARSDANTADRWWTAITARPPLGDYAEDLGQRFLTSTLGSIGDGGTGWIRRVAVSTDPPAAIAKAAATHDLIMVGSCDQVGLERFLRGSFLKRLSGDAIPPVAVFRRGLPLHHRLQDRLEKWSAENLPQLDREDRISLVARLSEGSHPSLDYKIMIVLATLIAGLGLLLNSTAVVVGAMLVAPLMTPIVGAGLALTQGNGRLMRTASTSILTGFLGALLVGLVLGTVVPGGDLNAELLARTGPNLLDLGVALISGVAAAYAMSRPSLSAALPGVAIAAALVPPVATIGIALARAEWPAALGASLLFGTNVIAIILGSAVTLWLVGVRPRRGDQRGWVAALMAVLLIAVGAIGIPLGTGLVTSGAPSAALEATCDDMLLELIAYHDSDAELSLTVSGMSQPSSEQVAALVAASGRPAEEVRIHFVQRLTP